MEKHLILASNSPRRREILTQKGFEFKVVKSDFEEAVENLSPENTVKQFAFSKAKDVFDKLADKNAVVLGADTVVSIDGQILGKPKTKEDASQMLLRLSGKTHQVWTGYCILLEGQSIVEAVKTDVVFNELSSELIDEYVATEKPMDKAGAYGIQDGFNLVKEYRGSYSNVVGLPIEEIEDKLRELLK